MFGWLKPKIAPLEGAPAVRRQKTFQSQTGYVYQYYFQGSRRAKSTLGPGYEFVFAVKADRKSEFSLSIHVADAGIAEWEHRSGRELLSKERYAVAKMALFEAFDNRPEAQALQEPVLVGTEAVETFLKTLGRD